MGKSKKRILITGTTGLVGHRLYEHLKTQKNCEIIGTSRSSGKYVDYAIDLTDADEVNDLKNSVPADVVIHTAAVSKTDECEKDREKCYAVNVISTRNLLSAYDTAKFVYFSTYAVYNLPQGKCRETDPITSTNYYIKTKILGENLVRVSPYAIILRPSVIFGFTSFERNSKNYFMQLLDNIRNKKVTKSPLDQFFNPIIVEVVANVVKNAINKDIHGIFNLGSNEDISKYEFNKKIIRKFQFDEQYLKGIDSQLLEVARPNNGTISSNNIQKILQYNIPNLDRMIDMLYESTKGYLLISEYGKHG